jgi:hypothetical protein
MMGAVVLFLSVGLVKVLREMIMVLPDLINLICA